MGKAPTAKKRSILLVDDHPIVLEGLKQLIDQQPDLRVCGELADGRATLATVERLRPDLAVVDLSLKNLNGLDVIKSLKAEHPALPVLALSMHDEMLYAERALRAGASGYVMKQEATKNLLGAVRRILDGGIYLSDNVTAKLLHRVANTKAAGKTSVLDQLSDRELEVFRLIGEGASTRRIAEMLKLSIKTIESHRENIKRKLDLQDAAELVQCAVTWVHDSAPKRKPAATGSA
ncbi:MAG TPA: response regulator transcription factor [Verrucomicrobiae bacterium]|jgi:DNA-binding NarL/FixJ family response regulator|nr:response regulator transcription factor [Verrucomicrobiae bacterium]